MQKLYTDLSIEVIYRELKEISPGHTRSVPVRREHVVCNIFLDWTTLEYVMDKAARNKRGISKSGPIIAKIKSRKEIPLHGGKPI
jgi:hypothetical protein